MFLARPIAETLSFRLFSFIHKPQSMSGTSCGYSMAMPSDRVSEYHSFAAPIPTPCTRHAIYSIIDTKTKQPVRSWTPRKLLPSFKIDPATGVPISSPKEATPKEKPYIEKVNNFQQQSSKFSLPVCSRDSIHRSLTRQRTQDQDLESSRNRLHTAQRIPEFLPSCESRSKRRPE